MSAGCANPRGLTVKGGARTSLICVPAINAAAHPVLDLFLTPESWPEHVQVHRLGGDTGGPIGPPGKGPGDMDGGPRGLVVGRVLGGHPGKRRSSCSSTAKHMCATTTPRGS
jgi:hypothetical protein